MARETESKTGRENVKEGETIHQFMYALVCSKKREREREREREERHLNMVGVDSKFKKVCNGIREMNIRVRFEQHLTTLIS